MELFENVVPHFCYRQQNKAHEEEKTVPIVKHGSVTIMLRARFAGSDGKDTE